jgi:GDP-L-fucose synthase
MNKDSSIFIAGHNGMVGSALLKRLRAEGYRNLILKERNELDLTKQPDVLSFFDQKRPEYVFLAAAKVGGIFANDTYPAEFIYQNLMIEANVVHAAYKSGVKKLLFLGSSCIYPKYAMQPLKEEYLLTGKVEPTNEAYAIAKIAGLEMCKAYNRQYGTQFISVMPTNLYGPHDNFDPETSHVLPAMIHKFHSAKINKTPGDNGNTVVSLWGTGSPKREFLHADDLADACLFLVRLNNEALYRVVPFPDLVVNIGVGQDITINELANLIGQTVGYVGSIRWDESKPDGTPRKLLDVSKIHSLGWQHRINLREGISMTYQWYLNNHLKKS